MSASEKALQVSLLSTDIENVALIITVSNDYKEPVSPQILLSVFFSQSTTPSYEVRNNLRGSTAFQKDEMQNQEASSSAPLTVIHDSKTPQKMKSLRLILQSPRKKIQSFNWSSSFYVKSNAS